MDKIEVKEIDSVTEDLGVIYESHKLEESLKILRMCIKEACVKANLAQSSSFNTKEGEYYIKYEYAENIRFSAGETHFARFISNNYNNVEIHIIPRGKSINEVIDKMSFIVADPEFFDQLVDLIEKMNRGYTNE